MLRIEAQWHYDRRADRCQRLFGGDVIAGKELQVLEQVQIGLPLRQSRVGLRVVGEIDHFDLDAVVVGQPLQDGPEIGTSFRRSDGDFVGVVTAEDCGGPPNNENTNPTTSPSDTTMPATISERSGFGLGVASADRPALVHHHGPGSSRGEW